jgi:hypothetical protein
MDLTGTRFGNENRIKLTEPLEDTIKMDFKLMRKYCGMNSFLLRYSSMGGFCQHCNDSF